jgi:hypothetical protein
MGNDHLLHVGCDEDVMCIEKESFLCYFCEHLPSDVYVVVKATLQSSGFFSDVGIERYFVCIFRNPDTSARSTFADFDLSELLLLAEIDSDSVELFFKTSSSAPVYRFVQKAKAIIDKYNESTGSDVVIKNLPECWSLVL